MLFYVLPVLAALQVTLFVYLVLFWRHPLRRRVNLYARLRELFDEDFP
jgi:hypothetical protein